MDPPALDASDASWTSGSFDEERRTFAQRFREFEKSSPVDELFSLGQGVIPVKLPDFDDKPEFTGPTVVAKRTDIDMNGHVNNVAYIGWALEALPLSESKQFDLKEIEIEFKNEALQGCWVYF
eukprot:jgi/Pico_ML_1/54831/g692.t1